MNFERSFVWPGAHCDQDLRSMSQTKSPQSHRRGRFWSVIFSGMFFTFAEIKFGRSSCLPVFPVFPTEKQWVWTLASLQSTGAQMKQASFRGLMVLWCSMVIVSCLWAVTLSSPQVSIDPSGKKLITHVKLNSWPLNSWTHFAFIFTA